jgi:hypothetical protein
MPPQMFTSDGVTPTDETYEKLMAKYPQYVRRQDGNWEIDMWREPGAFSPAIKELYAMSAEYQEAVEKAEAAPAIEQPDTDAVTF